jgi:hypothetical protein
VRANAYASLKELDAISQNVGPNIELEYRPGQVDAEGHPDLMISDQDTPFEFSFLYDYENDKGKGLSSFESYLYQVTNTLHLQLFSPLSDEYFSEEDNDIIGLISDAGRNRYCSAGVATLEYPYEEIVEYCALRWAESSLSSKWLRLDQEYERELDDWRRDKEVGDFRPKPKIEERYPKLLEMHASEDNPDPFFRQTYRSLHQKDEEESLGAPKSEAFVDALEAEIEGRAEDDDELQQKFRSFRRALDNDKLDQEEHAERIVTETERVLSDLDESVTKFIDNNKATLFNQVVIRDFDEGQKSGGQPYRLNTWILEGNDAPLHPVAVRCFLYQVKQILEERVDSLQSETSDLSSTIDSYKDFFDLESTDREETPRQRARAAKEQGLIGQLFNNKLSDFADLYSGRAHRQMQYLRRFLVARLKEHVLSSVLDAVGEIIDHHERYFRDLEDVFERLETRLSQRATEHEDRPDQTRRFVLASKEDKERLWNELSTALASDVLISEDIAQQIYVGHYDRYCRERLDKPVPTRGSDTTARLFEEQVLDWCRTELRKEGTLDKNVFEALQTAAKARGQVGKDEQWEFAGEAVNYIENAARPWLNPESDLSQDFSYSYSEYWGAHPDAVRAIADDNDRRGTLPRHLSEEWFGNNLVRNPAFSRYKLIHYQSIRGLRATNLPEFSASSELGSAGAYYEAYRNRVHKLTGQSDQVSVTPHLDKRWHLPVYLADPINPETVDQKEQRAGRAFAQGLALGLFTRVTADQQPTWQFDGPRGSQLLRIDGQPCGEDLHALYEALQYNPVIVDLALEKADNIHQEDKTEYPMTHPQSITQHRFHEGCHDIPGVDKDRNLLDAVLAFAREAPGQEEILNQSIDLLQQTLDEIGEYYRFVFGSHKSNTAAESAANLVETLREKSTVYQQADENTRLRNKWEQVIDNKVSDLRQ